MIEKYPFIIDGGLSNVLEAQGCDINHKLWTANMLANNPETIIQAHADYLKAGAQCITTSSYQASIPGLMEEGYNRDSAEALILKSVELAEIAIQRSIDSGFIHKKPLVAASAGPYGAYLADGSEYRGNYGVSDNTLRTFHLERIKILDRSNADLLAMETIPDFQEAKVIADILFHVDKPAWVSFSCRDEQHLNDRSKLQDAVSLFRDHPKVFAIGVNCTAPNYISGIIRYLKASVGEKKIVIYPNSGEVYNAKNKMWSGLSEPETFVAMAEEWSMLGADILGGCCRIGPDHIRRMRKVLLKEE